MSGPRTRCWEPATAAVALDSTPCTAARMASFKSRMCASGTSQEQEWYLHKSTQQTSHPQAMDGHTQRKIPFAAVSNPNRGRWATAARSPPQLLTRGTTTVREGAAPTDAACAARGQSGLSIPFWRQHSLHAYTTPPGCLRGSQWGQNPNVFGVGNLERRRPRVGAGSPPAGGYK
jgi:hypothetical protein